MTAAFLAPQGANESNLRDPFAKSRQVLSGRLARMSLETIAQVLKKDDTEACKVRSGERKCSLTEFCDLLDAAGLKLVGKDRHCVDEQTFQYMTRIVSKAMGNQQVAQTLIWEDD